MPFSVCIHTDKEVCVYTQSQSYRLSILVVTHVECLDLPAGHSQSLVSYEQETRIFSRSLSCTCSGTFMHRLALNLVKIYWKCVNCMYTYTQTSLPRVIVYKCCCFELGLSQPSFMLGLKICKCVYIHMCVYVCVCVFWTWSQPGVFHSQSEDAQVCIDMCVYVCVFWTWS